MRTTWGCLVLLWQVQEITGEEDEVADRISEGDEDEHAESELGDSNEAGEIDASSNNFPEVSRQWCATWDQVW